MTQDAPPPEPERAPDAVRAARAAAPRERSTLAAMPGSGLSIGALFLLVLLLIGLWGLVLQRTEVERERAVADQIAASTNLVLAHAERAASTFQLHDQLLLTVRTELLMHGLPSDLNGLLESLGVNRAHVLAVTVLDVDGRVVSSTQPKNPTIYRDREYFLHHMASAADELLIGPPLQGRQTGEWVITMTRRISGSEGQFRGVVLVALDPAFIADEYLRSQQGPRGSMALIGRDGITRARRNGDRISYGEDVRSSQLFRELESASSGHYVGVAASDGHRRLVVYRALDNYPLVSIVAASYDDLLALGLARGRPYLAAATGATAAVVLLVLLIATGWRRRQEDLRALVDSERRYRMLFDASAEAVLCIGADATVQSANPAAVRLFGLQGHPSGQLTRDALLDPTDERVLALTRPAWPDGDVQGSLRMRRMDGSSFEAEFTASPYPDGSGRTSLIVRDVTERQATENQIRQLAFYDPLTGLPNRRLLMDRLKVGLAHAQRHGRLGALLFLDLDNFKIINDTLGHQEGDRVLCTVAERLRQSVRDGDTCARIGGDEFVVMLEELGATDIDAAQRAEAIAGKLLQTLAQPCQLSDRSYRVTPSIGVTLFGGLVSEALDAPLQRADLAMYQAKSAGRNTVRFFDPQIETALRVRTRLEAELRDAIEAGELRLHLQPRMGAAGSLSGAEALVRWQHATRGLVPPAEFIPMAEECGLIVPLGHWVLKQACERLVRWQSHPRFAALSVSVNVSERQFRQADFVDSVLQVLQDTGAAPTRLVLELTEGLLVTEVEDVITKMQVLRRHGLRFALDDFGTGYSSLSYLSQMPLDELKIDQSFVRDVLNRPQDAAIARMVIALADNLGLTVVAEGVETEAQHAYLAEQGCHAFQGYLFGRPVAVDAFEARWGGSPNPQSS